MHYTPEEEDRIRAEIDAAKAERSSASAPTKTACQPRSLALATCSLPVSLVDDVATLMTDCAPQVTQWQAQWLVALAAELRAHAASASVRQPAENTTMSHAHSKNPTAPSVGATTETAGPA